MNMKFIDKLNSIWAQNNSLVCVGLDPDLAKMPVCVKSGKNPIFAFNRAIIDATCKDVCCYKPQIAYFAAAGAEDPTWPRQEARMHRAYRQHWQRLKKC